MRLADFRVLNHFSTLSLFLIFSPSLLSPLSSLLIFISLHLHLSSSILLHLLYSFIFSPLSLFLYLSLFSDSLCLFLCGRCLVCACGLCGVCGVWCGTLKKSENTSV